MVVRPGDVYGPGSVPWTVRPAELLRARPDGAARAGRRDDAPRLHRRPRRGDRAALRRGEPGHAYTVWDGEPVSFERYFTRLAEMTGAQAAAEAAEAGCCTRSPGRRSGVARLRGRPPAFGRHGITFTDRRGTASNRRAREELGWEPRVGLEEGLRRSAEWLEAERA